MTDHAAAALLSLQAADEMPGIASAEYHHREALIHATLEQAKWLHEIADQLDAMPRSRRRASPMFDAADLLEQTAIGDEGAQRERTIARLLLHTSDGHAYGSAPLIAKEALEASMGRDNAAEVEAAVQLLGIEVDRPR